MKLHEKKRSNTFLVSNIISLIMLLLVISPQAIQAESAESEKLKLATTVRRCRYYFIRFKVGDPKTRYILLSQDPNAGNITGLEKCFQVIDDYLNISDLTSDERRVYENLRENMSLMIEKLPRNEEDVLN